MAVTEQQRRIIEDMIALGEVYRESNEFDQHELHRTFLITDTILRNQLIPILTQAIRPRAVTVVGGTNVGKSTITNLLLGAPIASSSAEASHTRNAAAFIPSSLKVDSLFGDYEYAFAGSTSTGYQSDNQHSGYRYYVEHIQGDAPLGESILWDTPDVDSTQSQEYLHSVIEAVTLSDVVVLVTTAQKYADDRIVRVIAQLMDIGLQPVVCFNQYKPEHEALVQQIRETLVGAMQFQPIAATDIPVYRVPYLTNSVELYDYPTVLEMREYIRKRLSQPVPDNTVRVVTFLREHLHRVLTPMLARIEAFDEWNSAVRSESKAMYAEYETNYIKNPDKYDAFKEASTYMLHLVTKNMKGLQGMLQKARNISAAPTKLIQQIAQSAYTHFSTMSIRKNPALNNKAKRSNDLTTIREINAQLSDNLFELINTNRQRPNSHSFWEKVEGVWYYEQESILQNFEEATLSHWRESQIKIVQTAEEIYRELEKDPKAIDNLKATATLINGGAVGGQLTLIFTGPEFALLGLDPLDPLLTVATERIMTILLESKTTARIINPVQADLQGFFKHSAHQLIQEYCEKPLLDVGVKTLEKLGGLNLEHYDSMKTLRQRIESLLKPLVSESQRINKALNP